MNARLCYIRVNIAYFTTRNPWKEQTGDDWDDAPYQYNAGPPYEWHKGLDKDKKRWEIIRIAFLSADLMTPEEFYVNADYSVDEINNGVIPWLFSPAWVSEGVKIFAGETISCVIKKLEKAGAEVFLPREVSFERLRGSAKNARKGSVPQVGSRSR